MKKNQADLELDPSAIDKLIHEPARLLLMACLSVVDNADFTFLQSQVGLTGGNISSHMSRLEAAGYVTVEKSFVDRRPQTVFALTEKGRAALARYRRMMIPLLDSLVV